MEISLKDLKIGKKAKILKLSGGHQVQTRLNSLGILPGKEIMKMSSLSSSGPVTIKVGHSLIALGRGMVDKIMLEEI